MHIKWREVLDYKRELLRCLSLATGWGVDKLDADMQRPLYMRPQVPQLLCPRGSQGGRKGGREVLAEGGGRPAYTHATAIQGQREREGGQGRRPYTQTQSMSVLVLFCTAALTGCIPS